MINLCVVTLFSICIFGIDCNTPASSSSEEKSRQVDKYTNDVVKNDKIREVYIKCLLDKGPCNEEAADVKKMLPEAVERGCAKCSEMHKKMIEKMMLHLKEKQPEILKQVATKFDPKGEFMKTFLSKLKPSSGEQSAENGKKDGKTPTQTTNQHEHSTQPSQTQQPKPIKN